METNCPLSSEISLMKTCGEQTWLSDFQGQEIKLKVARVLLIFMIKKISIDKEPILYSTEPILSYVWQDDPAVLRPLILKTLWALLDTSSCSYIKFLKCLGICVLNSVIRNMCENQLCRHHFDFLKKMANEKQKQNKQTNKNRAIRFFRKLFLSHRNTCSLSISATGQRVGTYVH